ncbi:hypothetical protein MLD38_020118 [Melastoma candidum]|uniref:Uncharacterized protein n=1 Tax=Melastoma candidum TaxID=119954 RepID=A0ACB9QD68_9MYRT|nr:hypothetical protein MLD38_020118 [Melastoma candidum]
MSDSDVDHPSPSQPWSSSQSSETYLLGFVIANIVGIQYYSGAINGREMVGLVREPLNPYDSNALRVLNTRSLQVGHIERAVAAVLSPLIDSNLIVVEGIVPNSRSAGNKFRMPCQVHVFCRFEAFGIVKDAISDGGLVLVCSDEAEFGLSEAVVVKEERKKNRSVDEVFRLLDESVDGKGQDLVKLEAPREVVKSGLFEHQKEGLGWLVRREQLEDLPPFWKKSEERRGGYVNELTNYWTDSRPEPLRGGIFADDMGLGKTLTLIALIALDKFCRDAKDVVNDVDENQDDDEEHTSGKKRKGKKGGKGINRASGSRKKRKTAGSKKFARAVTEAEEVPLVKATLVVCPPSVFSSWIMQLGEHTIPGKLKVYLYYGERTNDVDELRKYDIVLTTYSILATEESWEDSPMKKMEWWRVILDEAHVIKNDKAQQSKAVINLKGKRRWVVSGTPIQNGSQDLFSLMAFLRFEPFSIKGYWNSLIQRPIHQGDRQGLSRLQTLMAAISLRRTKEKGLIGLPEKTIETCYIELSAEERSLYDQMETEVKSIVSQYINASNLSRNYTTMLSIILRLRQICISMSLCPDLKSLLPSNNIGDVSNNPELLQKVVAVLQDGEDFDCPICISPPTDIVITRCAHIFCRACILKTLQSSKRSCPLCRGPLMESDLFSAPPEAIPGSGESESSSSRPSQSSKVSALMKLLVASREKNPSTNSVVFSQFRKMLILLDEPLRAAGFKVLCLDGSMNVKRRGEVIREFGEGEEGKTCVLLASLKASGTGINLTAASRVYLLEPWWNPAVEEQAMDRVHRIGQKEDVTITRLIARNSIEERILALQDQKKTVAREAFGKKSGREQSQIGWNDLRKLVNL